MSKYRWIVLSLAASCLLVTVLAMDRVPVAADADLDPDVFIEHPKGEIQTVAELEDLMHGIGANHKMMRDALIKKDFHKVPSPAMVTAELANIVALHGKKADFKEHADKLKDAAIALAKAARSEDFPASQAAFGKMNDACSSCHNIYRVEEDDDAHEHEMGEKHEDSEEHEDD